jgi:hypothetical protein
MTPDKNFRLKPSFKTLIALSGGDAHSRGSLKRALIDAQLCEEAARRNALKSKDSKEPRGITTARAHTAPATE